MKDESQSAAQTVGLDSGSVAETPPRESHRPVKWAPPRTGTASPAAQAAAQELVREHRRPLSRWWRRMVWTGLAVAMLPLVLTIIYGMVPPPISNLMLGRLLMGNGLQKDWVSFDELPRNLSAAVIASEDARFCAHQGVDWREVQNVFDDALDDDEGPLRGASTITMQTAKNLFLWEGRGVLGAIRKGLEIPLALYIDKVWSKRRTIEIYLNIVEWAPGVYGAEAAARHHFKKSASKLTNREAALLAAVLPNPIKRNAGKPSRRVRGIADRIRVRASVMGPYLTCLGEKSWL